MPDWNDDQKWEASWWANCANTYGEETKQLLYAEKMGLRFFHDGKSPYNLDMHGACVVDLGGGPCSLLLKCHHVAGTVVDPCLYPDWVLERYWSADISFMQQPAETFDRGDYDEAWIYNVLQHVQDPARVIATARRAAKVIRLFEWIDTYVAPGHPHVLTEDKLNAWLGGEGKNEQLSGQNTCTGRCYYGVFLGEGYAAL